jgi:hypothetical protein
MAYHLRCQHDPPTGAWKICLSWLDWDLHVLVYEYRLSERAVLGAEFSALGD